MKLFLKRLGFGFITWVVPYVASIPLLPVMQSAPLTFKAIMVLIGGLTAGIVIAMYFRSIEKDYFRESLYVAATWILLNWFLDFVALLPFTQQTLPRYFSEIGIEYIGLMAWVVAVGYLLDRKTRAH